MTKTAMEAMRALKGGSALELPTMHALVKAGNRAVWNGSTKSGSTWVLTKNASNNFTVKI